MGACCASSSSPDAVTNRAFVFIKPHAQTPQVRALVQEKLKEKGIEILSEGQIDGQTIDSKQLIDKHYYAIASKATLLTPDQLPVPEDKFEQKFGESWKDVLQAGKAVNAQQACKTFGLSASELEVAWRDCEPAGNVIKFGGGFYCGKMTVKGDTKYVFNAFFMSMRSKFTEAGTSIYYYSVAWKASDLKWSDFRGSVLGPTKPADAPPGSIRRTILDKWQTLGLKGEPNAGDNGVHASASPFEGLAERMNWLEVPVDSDPFGSALLSRGMSATRIKEWSVDPQVVLPEGGKGSIFDYLEDADAQDVCDRMAKLDIANPGS